MKIIRIKSEVAVQNHLWAKNQTILCLDPHNLPIDDVIKRIVRLNKWLYEFWHQASGWAPIAAAQLLNQSRLDRQVNLSSTLTMWIGNESNWNDGHLILAWANLGILIEGSLKLFLSVWHESYKEDVDAISRQGKLQNPDGLQLEQLRQFFRKKIWDDEFDEWVGLIQQRRNAIHAYKDREIGTKQELEDSIRKYLVMLRYINYRLPYPDEIFKPSEID